MMAIGKPWLDNEQKATGSISAQADQQAMEALSEAGQAKTHGVPQEMPGQARLGQPL